MMIMLWIFAAGLLLEAILFLVPLAWRFRLPLATAALCVSGFSAGAITLWHTNVFSVMVGVVALFRAFNMIRILEGRMHAVYLRRATRRTAGVLAALQAGIAGGWLLWNHWHTTGYATWTVVAALQAVVAAVLLASTVRRLQHTAWPAVQSHHSDTELPTVTVAIPARNETEDLQACLESLIASDYPKLEIIVLDDCSQTRRTPEIIRDFAHSGVRFIQGEEPRETWLPKNQAYDRLVDEATGEYVLFCGVDVRFDPLPLRRIIGTMLTRNKQMMSILPLRAPEVRSHVSLAQAMRYCWELVPPRRLFRRPPVLSSCWIVQKDTIERSGGFAAVSRSIVPEAHFAKALSAADGYSFMRAGANPGVTSVKGAAEQLNTAIRMRYPQLHRRPENALVLLFAELFFLVAPFGIVGFGWLFSVGPFAVVLAALSAVLLTITYELVAVNTHVNTPLLALVASPVVALYDMGMVQYSMWRYEFSDVDWKGRNICVPAMHVIPHLPKLK
jgi:chlorobactene glucosyltransferase